MTLFLSVCDILRRGDEDMLKLFLEEPTLAVYVAVQNRLTSLHADRSEVFNKFATRIHCVDKKNLPPDLHDVHDMLREYTILLRSKALRIKSNQRRLRSQELHRDLPFRKVLYYVTHATMFTLEQFLTHPEHGTNLDVLTVCLEESYLRTNNSDPFGNPSAVFRSTYKADTLVSDWIKYDFD